MFRAKLDAETAEAEKEMRHLADRGIFNTELEGIFTTLDEERSKLTELNKGVVNRKIRKQVANIGLTLDVIRDRLAMGGNFYSVDL
jgi:hypothetical protein